MNELDTKKNIERALARFSNGSLLENSLDLLSALGYRSQRQFILSPNTFAGLVDLVPDIAPINQAKALVKDWLSVDILFQLTGGDVRSTIQGRFVFDDASRIDDQIIESYLFMAIRLQAADYPRGKLADLTREINKFFAMPVMILFQYGQQLTLSLINRRLSKREETRDVLEKVTLIKGINYTKPLRAHTEILYDLSLERLQKDAQFHNFVELHRAWQKVLDTSELNKRFYREVANWYFWAVKRVEFPAGAITDPAAPFAASVIRLITRLIFVWFIKEKGLVPHDLFNEQRLNTILNYADPKGSTYYKAILQNLFFAALNTEMGADRQFRSKNERPGGRDGNYGITSLYRYQAYFQDPAAALKLFAYIPFLNGGLFECLDKREENKFIDGFSDNQKNQPFVPDDLFFGKEQSVDLNDVYGDTKHGNEKVRGIIHTFNNYKFTIEENTPLEEEIALDPELLGKVFENLLAAYNPETGTTARKQTGSFYTPREIVNYMVDESLIAYLETKLAGAPDLQDRLRNLMAYNQEPDLFSPDEDQCLIDAIDEIKVLDPACGSGAFPMGMLHKLVYILSKLDPGNQHWKDRQIAKAAEIPDPTMRDQSIEDIEKAFAENELDYGRKLYLIENCIYGVDIQPIAVQIAKLRFFISLVVDQRTNSSKPNLGIRPLPNLETKFVAANTLIGIARPQKKDSQPKTPVKGTAEVQEKSSLLVEKFRQYLVVRNPALRESLLQDGLKLGEEINVAMASSPDWAPLQVQWIFETGKKLEDLRKLLPVTQPTQAAAVQLQDIRIKVLEDQLAAIRAALFTARTLETKRKYRQQDKQLRSQIAELLKKDGWGGVAATQLAGWDPYDQNASAIFFDPEWMFGVIGGFDIVIGNPPYLESRHPAFDEQLKSSYQNFARIRWGDDAKYITKGADLLVYFLELAIFSISNNGCVVLITQNSWLDTEYGKKAQEFLLRNTNVRKIVDSDYRYFQSGEGPNINTVITQFIGNKPKVQNIVSFARYHKNFEQMRNEDLDLLHVQNKVIVDVNSYQYSDSLLHEMKWGMLLYSSDEVLDLLKVLNIKGKRLRDVSDFKLSLGQGLNLTKNHFISTAKLSALSLPEKALIPIFTSGDGALFTITNTEQFIIDKVKLTLSQQNLVRRQGVEPFDTDSTSKKAPILIMPRGIGRHFCAINSNHCFSSSGVDIYDNRDSATTEVILNLWLFLNSTIAWLIRELSGRKNLGGGMLKAEAIDLEPIPLYFDFGKFNEINEIRLKINERQALTTTKEIYTEEHKRIDKIVFDHLDLSMDLRVTLVEMLKAKVLDREKKSTT